MYLAMNRFKIVIGKEDEFETVWKSRETQLDGVKGFKKFNLIKGDTNKEFSLYVSHSEWNSEEDFETLEADITLALTDINSISFFAYWSSSIK